MASASPSDDPSSGPAAAPAGSGVVFDPRIAAGRPSLGASGIRFGSMAADADAPAAPPAAKPQTDAPAAGTAIIQPNFQELRLAKTVSGAPQQAPAAQPPRPMMYAAVTAPKPAAGNGAPGAPAPFSSIAKAPPIPRVQSAPPKIQPNQQRPPSQAAAASPAPSDGEAAASSTASPAETQTAPEPAPSVVTNGDSRPSAASPTPPPSVVVSSAPRSASPSAAPAPSTQQAPAAAAVAQASASTGYSQQYQRPPTQMPRPPAPGNAGPQQPYMNRRLSNQHQMGPQHGMAAGMQMPMQVMPMGVAQPGMQQWAGQAYYDPSYGYYQQYAPMNYQMYGQPAMMGAPSYQMRPPQQQMGPGTMPVRYSAPMQAQQPQQTPMSPATTSTTSSAPSTPAAAPVAFQLPRVSKGIKITNPDTGEAVKLPAVTVKEPAPSTPSPAPAAAVPVATAPVAAPATPTPPPAAIPTPVPTPESLEAPKTEAAARSRSISPLPATLPVRESKAIKIVRPEDAEKERKEKEAAEKEKKEKETAAPPPTPAPVAAPISVVEAEHVEPPAPEPTKEVAKTEEQPKPVDAEAPAVKSEAVVAEAGEPAASEPEASADVQGNGEEQPAKSATEPVVEVASSESVEPDSLEKKTTEEKPTEEKEAVAAEEKLAPVEAETEPAKESVSEEKPKVDEPKLPTQFVKPTSFEDVQYPDGVEAPARVNGILRYERIFLLRFKDAKDKWERPEGLPTNDVIYDDSGAARSGSSSAGRRAGSTTGLPARPGSQRPDMSNPLARAGSAGVGSSMRTSEERYAAARAGMAAAGGSFLSSFGPKPGGFTGMGPRATSAGGGALGGRAPSTSGRAAGGGRSRGGEKGGRQGSQGGKSRKDLELEAQFTIPLDQIKPLELSASAWAPPTVKKKGSDDDDEKLKRKLQGLLNKLSLEKFESISNQIMGIGIDDEASLALVIAGVFDKAVDEPNFGSMYARLCAKLSNELPKTRSWMMDEKDPSKNNLFRRLLLTKCQLEFEKGAKWSEIGKDREPKEISEMTLEEKQKVVEDEEKRQKMKRQALGNIRFIGELFNLGMLGEKIMHACIKQLLQDGAKNHGEEELESVCKLMATIGEKLDHAKAKAHMDEYFKVIKKLTTNQSLTSRIRFALQDIVDLREKYHWKARGAQAAGPKTIAEIRQAAEQEAEEQAQNLRALGRAGSGRGKDFYSGGGGRGGREPSSRGGRESLAAAAARGAQARQTGDLSNFGKVTDSMSSKRPGDVRLGPGASISSWGARGWKDGDGENRTSPVPMARQSSQGGAAAGSTGTTMSNMFSALADVGETRKEEPAVEASLPPAPAASKAKGDLMSADQAERLGESAIKEFFGPESSIEELVRSWEEFSGPSDHKCDDDILDKWFSRAFDIGKEDDPRVSRFGRALARMVVEKVMPAETLEKCVIRQSEFLEDLVPDVPRIFSIFGVIVGRLVAEQGIPMGFLADICQPLVDSPSRVPQAPKLLKPVFEEVLRADADAAPGLWEESELDLKSFWPGATGTDEAIAEWIQSNGLEAMFSGSGDADADGSAEVAEDALKQFIADAQSEPDALAPARLTSLLEALGAEQLASESVVSQIVGAVVRNAAQRTAQAQPEPPAPSREQYSEQRDTIKNHQKALMDLLPAEKSALRSVACSAIQDVCEELGYPSQFMSHMFRIFHELDILDDATYEKWLKDETRSEGQRSRAQAEIGAFVDSLRS